VKSTMTAISATFATVFMVSSFYRAPTPKEEAPHGGSGASGFHWGGTGAPFGIGTRDGEGTAITLNLTQLKDDT